MQEPVVTLVRFVPGARGLWPLAGAWAHQRLILPMRPMVLLVAGAGALAVVWLSQGGCGSRLVEQVELCSLLWLPMGGGG